MKHRVFARALVSLVFAGLAGIGLWEWMLEAWRDSPLDRFGFLFILGGLALLAVVLAVVESTAHLETDRAALPVLAAVLFLNLLARDYDIYILTALTLLPLIVVSIWLLLGMKLAVISLPAISIILLGIPGVPFLLSALIPGIGLAVKLSAAVSFCLLVQVILLARSERLSNLNVISPLQTAKTSLLALTFMGLSVAWAAPETGRSAVVDTSAHQIGAWRGVPLDVVRAESELFEGARITKFVYAQPDGSSLSVLKVVSDDVHDIHPPEYCLTGANWILNHRGLSTLETSKGAIRTTELDLEREGNRIHSRYWFNNGRTSLASVADLRIQRRADDSEDFSLFLVSSIRTNGEVSEREMVEGFLQEAL